MTTTIKDRKNTISKHLNNKNIPETLEELNKFFNLEITRETLKTTRIGIFVNDLRKHKNANDQVKEKCKELIQKWKGDMKKDGSETCVSSIKTELPSRNTVNDKVKFKQKEKTRLKCNELLYNTLVLSTLIGIKMLYLDSKTIVEIAEDVEQNVYDNYGVVDGEYKSKIRSLVSNLKTNDQLRNGVLDRSISGKHFASMTTEEMMSKDRKAQVEEAHKANMAEAVSAQQMHAETDMFKCGKCHHRKTTYFQMQTRSADEPMTTFVTCLHCNNRWKFC
jgi:transcription elongation factor S-II